MNNSTKSYIGFQNFVKLYQLRQTSSNFVNFVKNVFPFILQVKKTSTKGYR